MRFIAPPLYDVWVVQLLPLSTLYEKVEIYFLVCVGENLLKSSLGSPHSPNSAHLHLTFSLCHDRTREIFSMSSERIHEMCIIWKFINIQLLSSRRWVYVFCSAAIYETNFTTKSFSVDIWDGSRARRNSSTSVRWVENFSYLSHCVFFREKWDALAASMKK